ncbi:VIT family protein [uncultured archaeon]|nr:VIT family protein [uncultured archaeon]
MKIADNKEIKKTLSAFQKNEINEHFIYAKLSGAMKEPHNRSVLKNISLNELEHYNFWKKYTGEDVKPNNAKIWKYFLISKIFGITFSMKLMEGGEGHAQIEYEKISRYLPETKKVLKDEVDHEKMLICMIDEERLRYSGAIVLGMNDAIVELTGALAGFTLVLQNARLIALAAIITGVAASLSMAASQYLSTKSGDGKQNPFKASTYTGMAYLLTVLFLISPYFFLANPYLSLCVAVLNAIIAILIFTFYISIAKSLSFRKRFIEMALISLGVATVTFAISYFIKIFWNIYV